MLLGLCGLLAACGGLGSSGGGATPTRVGHGHHPTITPGGPTLTPKPTHTRAPTITPGGPTPTHRPTITPGGPTRTPTATIVPGSVPELFVRTSGSDMNDGRSPDSAVQTLTRVARLIAPGTTVYVGPGRYMGTANIRNVKAPAAFPIQFMADSSGKHTGDAPGPVVLDAGGAVASLVIENATNVVADGFTLTGALPQSVPKHLSAAAVEVRKGSDHAIIRNCVIPGNGAADGIRIESASVLAFNNLISGALHGVEIIGAATGVSVINNTIATSKATGISLANSNGVAPTGAMLANNIVQDSHKVSIHVDQGPPTGLTNYVSSFNLVFQPNFGTNQERDYLPIRARGPNDINDDAQFVKSSQGDFHLKTTSPAIDAGTNDIEASLLSILLQRSTTSDGRPDQEPVDVGYHYPAH
jgi:hypothetical protein